MITKPMLAATCTDENKITFPVLATPKIDGIRCLRINGRSVSRTFKDIPNRYIQEQMKDLPDGLDGELVVMCELGVTSNFQTTVSGVMSQNGEPKFEYWIFDFGYLILTTPYRYRIKTVECKTLPSFCKVLSPIEFNTLKQLQIFEQEMLWEGHEGVMIRQPDSPYKCGRSTEKEGYLLKMKRFKDAEATIVGLEEQFENLNPLEKDELGYAKRSKCQDEMYGKETLGKFVVKNELGTFRIGTGIGLTDLLRKQIWMNKDKYIGKVITYKYQAIGMKNLPRSPIFKGFREDM